MEYAFLVIAVCYVVLASLLVLFAEDSNPPPVSNWEPPPKGDGSP